MRLSTIFLVLLCAVINTLAQFALKAGAMRLGNFHIHWGSLFNLACQMALNYWIWIGLFLYVISVFVWISILARVPVSIAYPLGSIAYILNAFSAYYFLGENLTVLRIVGTVVILFGVCLVARS